MLIFLLYSSESAVDLLLNGVYFRPHLHLCGFQLFLQRFNDGLTVTVFCGGLREDTRWLRGLKQTNARTAAMCRLPAWSVRPCLCRVCTAERLSLEFAAGLESWGCRASLLSHTDHTLSAAQALTAETEHYWKTGVHIIAVVAFGNSLIGMLKMGFMHLINGVLFMTDKQTKII